MAEEFVPLHKRPVPVIELAKPAPLDCHDIQLALFSENESGGVVAFNSTRALRHEADVLVVRSSGVTVEYEVKVSRSDFRADFKKQDKHRQMAMGDKLGPQYFFYACAEGLLTAEDIPAYAGLVHIIQVPQRGYAQKVVRVIKPAPRLHKEKNPEIYHRLCRSMMHKAYCYNEGEREQNLREKIAGLENELGELYATIFGDGGHRQAELDANGYTEAQQVADDDLFGGPSTKPARYRAALDVFYELRQRAQSNK